MAAKRLHDEFDQDPDQPDDKRVRRLPSLPTVIREAMMMRSLQTLLRTLEPFLRRVVQEELQAGLVNSPRYIERPPVMPPLEAPVWKLAFRNQLHLPVFTGSKIKGADRQPLQVVLVDADTGPRSARPQSLRVEVVPLFGDFPSDDCEDWTADEFERGIAKERTGKRPLLTGDVALTMRDGSVSVDELQFTDNSSWVRCRKFRIGVRVMPGSYDGPRIREVMTNAFVVRDHRGELYRKHYPPVLFDDVWRLEKIGKEGAFHRRLRTNGIETVQEFLRLYMVKPEMLRGIMGDGMTDRMWEVTTKHAKTCLPGDKLYMYSTPECTIYVNSICEPVRIVFGDVEYPVQHLNLAQRGYVNELLLQVYEHRNNLQEVDVGMLHVNNNIPLLQNDPVPQLAPAQAPAAWYPHNQELEFQVDEVDIAAGPTGNIGLQWSGQYNFNMPG